MIYLQGCKHSYSWQLRSATCSLYTNWTWCTQRYTRHTLWERYKDIIYSGTQVHSWCRRIKWFIAETSETLQLQCLLNRFARARVPSSTIGRIHARVYWMSPNSLNSPFWACISQARVQWHGPHTREVLITWCWCVLSAV